MALWFHVTYCDLVRVKLESLSRLIWSEARQTLLASGWLNDKRMHKGSMRHVLSILQHLYLVLVLGSVPAVILHRRQILLFLFCFFRLSLVCIIHGC